MNRKEIELTRADYMIQDYINKMGGLPDRELGIWLRPTESERAQIITFLDGEIARCRAAEKQLRPADTSRASWVKIIKRVVLGDADLTFHDFRGTAVTRLAIAGATVAEIASITGHSLDTAQAILDKHYLWLWTTSPSTEPAASSRTVNALLRD
jgi:hypothetical protein